ncbi:MAG TPA: alpha/beta hydrolase [Microlunatus sp.]|nr:alpha/beta hydrolase [Microlunatus sp.]
MEESHTIETAVGKLAVRVEGDHEGAATVLWPSLFMSGRSFDRFLTFLTPQRRVVVIDGPGHGASGDPGHRYSTADCAQAAGQILDRLAIRGPVDWVGNAWGGHVGLAFAAARPTRCRSLVMLGTPMAALSSAERGRTYLLLAIYQLLGPIEIVLSGVTNVLLSAHTRVHDLEAVDLVRASLRQADRRMLSNAVKSVSLDRADATGLLPKIGMPTLIVTGRDHAGFTPDQATAAARLVRHGEVAVIPDAAYLVPLEAPETTAAAVSDFWIRSTADRPTDDAGPARLEL